jgi:uncharacterized repeat protein (TIGR02543 family)
MRKRVFLALVPAAGLLSLLWLSGSQSATSTATLRIDPQPINGNVISEEVDINCGSGGSGCHVVLEFEEEEVEITLIATPDSGYTFAEWTGDCSSCGTNTTCTINITMGEEKTCSANFMPSGDSGGDSETGGGTGAVGGTGGGGGGGGCSMTGSASSMAGLWNILVWLSVPAFVLARRIRRK